METHSDHATEISISDKNCWIIIKKNSLDEWWLSDREQTEETSHKAGFKKNNLNCIHSLPNTTSALPNEQKAEATANPSQIVRPCANKKKRNTKANAKIKEEVNLNIELIKYYSGKGDQKQEKYTFSGFLNIPIFKSQIWSSIFQISNELSIKSEIEDVHPNPVSKKSKLNVKTQIKSKAKEKKIKAENEENKGTKKRGPRREEWLNLMKQDLEKNKLIVESKINTTEMADALENIVFNSTNNKINSKYWDSWNYLSSNIKIVAEYPKIIELISRKKIDINILLIKGHRFRKKWENIIKKIKINIEKIQKIGDLRRYQPAIRNQNTFKVYSSMVNQASNEEICKDPSNSVSILQTLLNHESLKINTEEEENKNVKIELPNEVIPSDAYHIEENQNNESNLTEYPYSNLANKLDEDPTIIWSGKIRVSYKTVEFDIELHWKDLDEVSNIKKELIPTIRNEYNWIWPAGQAQSKEMMNYTEDTGDHEVIIGWAQYTKEINKEYFTIWNKLAKSYKWAVFKTSGLFKFYLMPLDEKVKEWLNRLLVNKKFRKQVFDPSLLIEHTFLLLYLTKGKSNYLKGYKTLKSLQFEQKEINLFKKILDQSELENLTKSELMKRIREGLSQWEDVIEKLNQLSEVQKVKLEKILRQILEQDS